MSYLWTFPLKIMNVEKYNNMQTQLVNILYITLAIASVSFTVTRTGIFEWLRELVSPIHPKVEQLFHCPYCLGHWITFVVLLIVPKTYLIQIVPSVVFNFFFTTFVIMGLAGLLHYVLLRAYDPVAETMKMRNRERQMKLMEQMAEEEKEYEIEEENLN